MVAVLTLQEALRLKEAKAVDEVVAVSLGPQQVQVTVAWVVCGELEQRKAGLSAACMQHLTGPKQCFKSFLHGNR